MRTPTSRPAHRCINGSARLVSSPVRHQTRQFGIIVGVVAFAPGGVAVSLGGVWAVTYLVALGVVVVGGLLWGRRLTREQATSRQHDRYQAGDRSPPVLS